MTWKNTRRRRKPVRWPYFERCEYACLYFLSICLSTDFILSILCIVFIAKSFIIFKIQSKGHESPFNSKAVSGTPVAKHPKCGRLTWQRLACHTLTVAMHVLLTEITRSRKWPRGCWHGDESVTMARLVNTTGVCILGTLSQLVKHSQLLHQN